MKALPVATAPAPNAEDEAPEPQYRSRGHIGWVVAGSLAAGLVAAAFLVTAPFVPPTEAGVTGAVLCGWALGWALLAVLSARFTDQRQSRAAAPALVMGLSGVLLVAFGYNYPGFPARGVLAMVAFCIGMSFVLSAVRELTDSLIPVAAAHGMLNGIAPILLILAPDTHPILAGPLGILGAAIFTSLGAGAWTAARRRTAAAGATNPGPRSEVPQHVA